MGKAVRPVDMLTIGKMAELNNVTKKTLLTYEREGLLVPARVDEATGYRFYDISQSAVLDMIQQMKNVGLSLAEIKDVLERRSVTYLDELLKRKDAELADRIRSLALSRSTARRLMETCDLAANPPRLGVPTLEWVDARRILYFPVKPYRLADRRASDPPELNAWEISLRRVKSLFAEEGLPLQLFYNVGAIIPRASLESRAFLVSGAYVYDPVGIDSKRAQMRRASWCLTMTTDCMFAEDGTHLEKEYLERMLDIVDEEEWMLDGGYYSEILAETPAFLYTGRDMMLRLRVPVAVKDPQRSRYYDPTA